MEEARIFDGLDEVLGSSARQHKLRIVEATDVVVRRVEWLERDRVPFGYLTLCEGQGGVGKTSFVLGLIAHATSGRLFFNPEVRREPLSALIVAEEDDLGHLRAKLSIAGADLSRVAFVDATMLDESEESFVIPRDATVLNDAITKRGASIVYIDALFSHLDLEGEGRMAQQMRGALRPLAAVARSTGSAIMATRHWSKGAKAATDRGLGSVELTNMARSILSFGRLPGDEERLAVATGKHNLAAQPPALGYHLEPVETLDDDGKLWSVVRAVIDGPIDGLTADDLAMRQPQHGDERDAMAEATEAILAALELEELPAKELSRAMRDADVSPRTFERARTTLRSEGRIERLGGGVAGPVRWRLTSIDRQGIPLSAISESGEQCDSLAKSAGAANASGSIDLLSSWSSSGMACSGCGRLKVVDLVDQRCRDCRETPSPYGVGHGAAFAAS